MEHNAGGGKEDTACQKNGARQLRRCGGFFPRFCIKKNPPSKSPAGSKMISSILSVTRGFVSSKVVDDIWNEIPNPSRSNRKLRGVAFTTTDLVHDRFNEHDMYFFFMESQ